MISVIVPVYNVEKYIVKCLESIVNQSYKDFELLLVNDGSTDNSIELINDYLKDYNINWKLINKDNGGQSSARNLGLKESKGDYVLFMDSDDVVSTDFLDILYSLIIDNNADFSFCNFRYVKKQELKNDEDGTNRIFNRKELLKTFLKREINFVIPSMLFRKDFLIKNNIVFNEDIRFSEDQMYIWDVIFKSNISIYSAKVMYGYYLREKSIMTASPYERIVKADQVFSQFCNELEIEYKEYKNTIKYILPRWELGTLYTSAKLVDYEEYSNLYKLMNGKKMLKRIKGIKEIKSYLLALVCSTSCSLLYSFCRKLDLNG